jgi:2-amino-4-hydroxy-6-hydroxymethyldihydropteridine diphosphokinase
VLLLEGVEHESERLCLPHAEVTSRRFVLVPLLELDPDLEVPGCGPAAAALSGIEGQEVRRACPPLDVRP